MVANGDFTERIDIKQVISEIGDRYLEEQGGVGIFGDWQADSVVVKTMRDLVRGAVLKEYKVDQKTGLANPHFEYDVNVAVDRGEITLYGPARMEYEIPLKLGEPYEWNDWFKDALETAVSKVLERKKIRATDKDDIIEEIYEDVEKELDKAFCEVAQEKLLDRLKSAGFECWEEDENITCVLHGEPHERYDDEGDMVSYVDSIELKIDKC